MIYVPKPVEGLITGNRSAAFLVLLPRDSVEAQPIDGWAFVIWLMNMANSQSQKKKKPLKIKGLITYSGGEGVRHNIDSVHISAFQNHSTNQT